MDTMRVENKQLRTEVDMIKAENVQLKIENDILRGHDDTSKLYYPPPFPVRRQKLKVCKLSHDTLSQPPTH